MKRTERINFWLGDKDLAEIDLKAKAEECSRSEFIRRILSSAVIILAPDIDYRSYANEFNRLGTILNDVVKNFNVTGVLDKEAADDVWLQIKDLCERLRNELIEKTVDLKVEENDGKK